MIKHILLTISCWLIAIGYVSGQSLTLNNCYTLAKQNFPLIKQYELIEKSKEYSIENANKGYLPQFNIAGQATYQSAVTHLPISLPNINIPTISKDQYRLYSEVSQPITDLFVVKDNKNLIETNAQVETQKVEVELYKLRERINQLYFGILLIDEQIQQTTLLKKDIESGMEKTNVAIKNGTAITSNLNILKAELLKANQRTIELKAIRNGYAEMLAYFIGQTIGGNTILTKPTPQVVSNTINRPELKLYDLQKKTFDLQNKLITAKNLPRFSLFFQGGLGRPALNMLSNDFKGYYIGGLRLNWNLTGFYTYNNEKKNLSINQNSLDIQRETFLFNTNLNLRQQNAEIIKVQELIVTDSDIISLRKSVKNTTKIQLENGTATTNDYLIAVNAEDQARQSLILHEIQLLMAQYNYQTTTGN
ncbi:TolC family protein [Pedobacter sp. UBA4863]|uniref:TolC family protein n=1 Tax=Pedobacter sp. UBA4863 TaxID=1947060 RepID=UPI0025F588D6|nr:TolC family protein [Pedobacter sp. UBA4863]